MKTSIGLSGHSRKPHRRSPGRVHHRRRRLLFWFLPVIVLTGWLGLREVERAFLQPQAIFVLGGDPEREVYAAMLARKNPQMSVWVSSGSNPEYAEWVFQEAGIAPQRVHLDYRAVDTVTNFTTMVDTLKAQGIRHVYLVTSDFHMSRATVVGEIVMGSRWMNYKPVVVPTRQPPEPLEKSWRDGLRAMLWVFTGRTGVSFKGR